MAFTPLVVATCLLLVLQGVVSAPTGYDCCLPGQFENTLAITLGQVLPNVGPQGLLINGSMHADFTNKRIAVNEQVTSGSYIANLTVIEDLKAKLMYVITKSTKTCIKLPLPTSPLFPSPPCTHNNFNYTGTQKLGMADESLDVNIFQVKTNNLLMNLYLTKAKCLPVFESFMASLLGTPQVQGQVYSDITLGIKDPSVFNIPDYCQKSQSSSRDVLVNDAISRHRARRGIWA